MEGIEREEVIEGTPPPKRAKFFFMVNTWTDPELHNRSTLKLFD